MYVENKDVALTDLGGGVVRKVLAYSENLMSVELHFDKGAVGAKHSHPHEQIGYLISGSLLFQEAGKRIRCWWPAIPTMWSRTWSTAWWRLRRPCCWTFSHR